MAGVVLFVGIILMALK